MIRPLICVALAGTLILPAMAQVPDGGNNPNPIQPPQPAQPAAPAAQPAQAQPQNGGNPAAGGSNFLGKDVPFLDPGSEVVTWDGKNWSISNNRIFKARFEKYLNAPESELEADNKYQKILDTVLTKLAPNRTTPQSMDEAFYLLAQASEYDQDAKLCDSIAKQVYSAWQAKKSNDRMNVANKSLEEERKRLEWNSRIASQGSSLDRPPASEGAALAEWQKQQQMKRDIEMQPMLTRIAEIQALQKANQLKKEVGELQVKIEFQSLLLQLFFQRRFQHVVIGTSFYRNIFSDGDSQLRVGEDAKNLFAKTTGLPPTVGTLDTMANEVMRDIHEGISAFDYLLEKKELESASNRLMETFLIGEYMPEVRTLSREKRREALTFVQRANQLISALEVKNYTLAEKLIKELQETARDFDASKAMAAIETAKAVSAMHIAKARNAAVGGDQVTLDSELRAAMEIWPTNPMLTDISTQIFAQGDVQARALVDFDQLVSQKNYRQIFDDQMRFIAATVMHPEKQEQLREVLERMKSVEGALLRAQEIEKRGDYAGAWESSEKTFREFSDDNKLNQVRANLTAKAADFVRALKRAEELEQKNQPGSSLAWYLKAQSEYPPSEFAREGIQRITKQILPDAS